MGMCMKENGLKIRPMDKENTFILTEQYMSVNGSMISSMVMERNNGLTVLTTKEDLKMEVKKVKEYCTLLMVQYMKDNSQRMKLTDTAHTDGPMERLMWECG